MNRFFAAFLGLVVSMMAWSVLAADLPLKAPAPIVAAEYDWTGVYGGINAGWVRDDYHWAYTNPAPVTCCTPFSVNKDTWSIGAQLGAQYQFNHFVLGVEGAVFNAADNAASFTGCVGANNPVLACQIKRQTTYTAGGRVGYAWDNWLIFGDGGGAWADVHSNLLIPGPPVFIFDSTSQRYSGWYAGVGFEYMLVRGVLADVIVGAEYQHIDLGTKLHLSILDGFSACPPGVNCRNIGATEDLVRARFSVKINPFHTGVVVAKN
jgi:outer membrane immunogenic protein